jgi:magnesium-transporting ATPase (P-type)
MYHFDGTMRIGIGKEELSFDLTLANFVPRGCVVCNCQMYAVVVYTGVDSKIIMN